jgi:iron complex outermembrane receptor protein
MPNWIVFLVGTCLLLSVLGHASAQAQFSDGLSPEELLFQEIPTVVTSTRTQRSLLEVPNAATVITAEEIRASGATSLEELLQTVSGLDLMRLSVADLNASVRGFNNDASSNVLAMIDGRSVYADFFGVVPWDGLNVTLQEIERIEIIRGPGSVLYGANAYLGTVNIITKRPRDLPTLYARTGLGPETSLVTTTAAKTTDRAGVKASIEYRNQDHFRSSEFASSTNTIVPVQHHRDDTGLRTRLFNGTLNYQLDNKTKLSISGGQIRVKQDIYTGVGIHEYEGPKYYARLDLHRGAWRFRTFLNLLDFDIGVAPTVFPSGLPPASYRSSRVKSSAFDIEVERIHSFARHELLWGLNFRRVVTNSRVIVGSRESEGLYAFFLQDELRLTDRITAFLGARADRHPRTGLNVSPRVSLVARLGEDARLRVAWSRSFRNPTTIESYATYALPNSALPLTVMVQGNDDLDPSWTTVYELGLRLDPHPRMRAQLDLFFSVLEDFRSFTTLSPGPPVTVLSYQNQGQTKTWGGELGLEYRLFPWLRGFANYSFQSAKSTLRWALTGVYVGHTRYEPGPFSAATLPDDDIDSRFTVDGFLGLQVREGIEVGVKGRNLFHQVRRHHPLGDEIGSELLFTLTGEF